MARTFGGTTDRIVIGLGGEVSSKGTIALWVRTTQLGNHPIFVSRLDINSRGGWGIDMGDDGKPQGFGYGPGAGGALAMNPVSATVITDGNPHHLALVFDGTATGASNQIYVDGVAGTASNSAFAWSTNVDFQFGKQADGFWPNMLGDLWEVGHWDQKLTVDEISALAGAGGKLPISPNLIRPSALRHYLPLVNDTRELRQARPTTTLTATSVSAHRRVFGGRA
jgi:hypothetical protein